MKIFFLVVSFLGNQNAFEKLKAYGDGREELMTDVRGTSCFVIKFGKAGEQLAAKSLGRRQDGFMPHQLTHLEKETVVK